VQNIANIYSHVYTRSVTTFVLVSSGDELQTFEVDDDDKIFVEFGGSTARSRPTSFARQDHACILIYLSCLLALHRA